MRDLNETLPSPSELDAFSKCPTYWYFKYVVRVNKIESAPRLISGRAVNDALCHYHMGAEGKSPLEVYDELVEAGKAENPSIPEDEWQAQVWMDRAALIKYLDTKPMVEPSWEAVVGVQVSFPHQPALGVPDLIYRAKAGHLGIVEWKVISGWADVEYENLKYEMAFQPIFYTVGASELYNQAVSEVEMRYLIRPKPASGRFKEAPADYHEHRFNVELWKKEMWLHSAVFVNNAMKTLVADPCPLIEIPKFTRACKEVMGSKTFLCEYYPACSANMSPVEMTEMYETKS